MLRLQRKAGDGASEKLAKSAAMFTDRIEHSGSVQMPVVIEVVGV